MPRRDAAVSGRMVKDERGQDVWCSPATAERIAQCNDYLRAESFFSRGENTDADEAMSLLLDWLGPVAICEEQILRTLFREPGGRFFVWTYTITINSAGQEIEADTLTLLSRERAWRWMQERDATVLADFPRFPSKRTRKS